MTSIAQPLPIGPIPEELLIAAMRDDVIRLAAHHEPLAVPALGIGAELPHGVLGQPGADCSIPPVAVAALGSRAAPRIELLLLLVEMLCAPAASGELWAAGRRAWAERDIRHQPCRPPR